MYAIPYKYYEKFGIRKYGFHGTSHRYVTDKMAELMGRKKENLKLITCHIGNGSSISAVKNGKVIDTTMGLTPLGGFMMGTRSGSLDPSVVTFIAEKEHLTPEELSTILNKQSGLLGISGVSSDDRDVAEAEANGNRRAHLAHEMLYYQIAQYIGSYFVTLGGCDGIVFTAGLGENQPMLREKVCDYLECLGVKINKDFNNQAKVGITGTISTPDSKIRVEVIATDEEMVIARDTKAIVEAL
jgi:acetate kinase